MAYYCVAANLAFGFFWLPTGISSLDLKSKLMAAILFLFGAAGHCWLRYGWLVKEGECAPIKSRKVIIYGILFCRLPRWSYLGNIHDGC